MLYASGTMPLSLDTLTDGHRLLRAPDRSPQDKNTGSIPDLELDPTRLLNVGHELERAAHGFSIGSCGMRKDKALLILNKAVLMANMEVVQGHQTGRPRAAGSSTSCNADAVWSQLS